MHAPRRRGALHPLADVLEIPRLVLSSLQEREPAGRAHVLRVFVDVDRSPPVVVTVYRSSKIGKYWSQP